MDKLEKVIRHFHDTGLYTHVYVACGFLDDSEVLYESSILPGGKNIFDLASLTKALVTTPLTLAECFQSNSQSAKILAKDVFGKDAICQFGDKFENLTVAGLLRHETGLPAWRNLYVMCEDQRQSLQAVVFASQNVGPNKKELYSDIGFMILGDMIIYKIGKPLDQLWSEFSKAIGVTQTGDIGSSKMIDLDRAISSGFCPVRERQLIGEVHDENAWALGGFAGHSGLFGTGPAVASYLQLLWKSAIGRTIIKANFDEMSSPGDSLMGWRKGRDGSSINFAEGRGCGHLGFTGTGFWVDPKTRSFAVVLTNRIISGRIPIAIKDMRNQAFTELWILLRENAKNETNP